MKKIAGFVLLFSILLVMGSFAFAIEATLPSNTVSVAATNAAEKIAVNSPIIMKSYNNLTMEVTKISNIGLRNQLLAILKNPAPSFMKLYQTKAEQEALYNKLIEAGFLEKTIAFEDFLPPLKDYKQAPQSFYAAPGSSYSSHHSYPGGLVTHVNYGLEVGLDFAENYEQIYGMKINRDLVISSYAIHDMMKPWVYQWKDDNTYLVENKIAGTGEHHIYGIAECFYRGLAPELVVAAASTHESPWQQEDKIVEFIRAAAVIANVDPVNYKALEKLPDGKYRLPSPKRPEYWIAQFMDHDWTFTAPAAASMITVMKDIAVKNNIQDKDFNSFRNRIFGYYTIEKLYNVYVDKGVAGVESLIKARI